MWANILGPKNNEIPDPWKIKGEFSAVGPIN